MTPTIPKLTIEQQEEIISELGAIQKQLIKINEIYLSQEVSTRITELIAVIELRKTFREFLKHDPKSLEALNLN